MRGINLNRYFINEQITFSFFIKKETSKKKLIIIKFTRDIYIVNNFKVNHLIKINILDLEKIIIDLL